MPYKLKEKENEFQVTKEGEFEYHHFKHGEIYDKVPIEEQHRFEETSTGTEAQRHKGTE
jgi:hypothetical protein